MTATQDTEDREFDARTALYSRGIELPAVPPVPPGDDRGAGRSHRQIPGR